MERMEQTNESLSNALVGCSCAAFTDVLASDAPTPGGGGASALVGALAAALCEMAGNLTLGRKKYAAVEPDIREMLSKLGTLRARLLALIDQDAADFAPLAHAYAIPKDDPARADVMERALAAACVSPMEMMRCLRDVVLLLEEMLEKGSAMLVSDVGVGAALARGALVGASMNVFVNTKAMANEAARQSLEREADGLLDAFIPRADAIVAIVQSRIRKRI